MVELSCFSEEISHLWKRGFEIVCLKPNPPPFSSFWSCFCLCYWRKSNFSEEISHFWKGVFVDFVKFIFFFWSLVRWRKLGKKNEIQHRWYGVAYFFGWIWKTCFSNDYSQVSLFNIHRNSPGARLIMKILNIFKKNI